MVNRVCTFQICWLSADTRLFNQSVQPTSVRQHWLKYCILPHHSPNRVFPRWICPGFGVTLDDSIDIVEVALPSEFLKSLSDNVFPSLIRRRPFHGWMIT